MSEKICSRCRITKPETEFAFLNKTKGTRQSICKTCQCAYYKQWHKNNNNYHNQYIKKRRQENRAFIERYKETLPCSDCGNLFPFYVMDFDHLPGCKKAFTISRHGGQLSKDALLQEISKCDLVCANCHRIRTWKRKDRFKNNNPIVHK